ncbi:MAG: ABC transporter ATP-binding protein [Patescibacteria group bacterium]|jgi:zinc/manganese transport system ATP-binding protein|nr:ABC transporter ATP-binding protein [Patescibacteria group bacterium]
MSNDPIIKADRISISYNQKNIIRDASFSVARNTFNVILGPNGSGKSTLFKVLLGLKKIDSGQIKLFGDDPKKGNKLIGYIPQSRDLEGINLRVSDFILLGYDGIKFGFRLNRSKSNHILKKVLNMVDGQYLMTKNINQLSGGELQKVYLAQSLVGSPDLLLLDEPLSNLDIKRENELLNLIAGLVQKNNLTVILITHDLNPIYDIVDKIIYIANKKLASGTKDQVLNSKILSELYDSKVEVIKDNQSHKLIIGIEDSGEHHV